MSNSVDVSREWAVLADNLQADFGPELGKEDTQSYGHLSLCVIDAVFSIQARYQGVKNVVRRYCERYALKPYRSDRRVCPPREEQDSTQHLFKRIESLGEKRFAMEVFENRARTSARNGILKAEAVRRFASALAQHGVLHLQDVHLCLSDPRVEETVRQIPGQRSGITLKYMLMLAGCDGLVKPDTMLRRYLSRTLRRPVRVKECQPLVDGAANLLRPRYPNATPRLLDSLIWNRESRRIGKDVAGDSCRQAGSFACEQGQPVADEFHGD